MSLRREQYMSLYMTREFLYDLMNSKTRPKSVNEMKQRASRCLRHFPHLHENGEPFFSADGFECPPIYDPRKENDGINNEVRE